jgi:hypothetical protein
MWTHDDLLGHMGCDILQFAVASVRPLQTYLVVCLRGVRSWTEFGKYTALQSPSMNGTSTENTITNYTQRNHWFVISSWWSLGSIHFCNARFCDRMDGKVCSNPYCKHPVVVTCKLYWNNPSTAINCYCFQNLVFITTCFGRLGHLQILQNIYKILGKILETLVL